MADSETLYGRNPVLEALRAGRRGMQEVLIAQSAAHDDRLVEIEQEAAQAGVPHRMVPRRELDRLDLHHQGVVLRSSPYPYSSLSAILDASTSSGEPPLILLLDSIQDPQNLGTLLRTAESVGVHGVLMPLRRAASVTAAVVSTSSGASEHMLIARENLAAAIEVLKKEGIWVVGLERSSGSVRLDAADLTPPLALVVGNEGHGLRRLVRERCDYLVEIPMRGRIASLNAAVAGSLALYRVWASRSYAGAR